MGLRTISNSTASLSVDLDGGAYTDFTLVGGTVNPFSFAFTKEQMPQANKNGATYKGHFACIGRWGRPSAGEICRGVPDHGHFANMMWQDRTTYFTGYSIGCEPSSIVVAAVSKCYLQRNIAN